MRSVGLDLELSGVGSPRPIFGFLGLASLSHTHVPAQEIHIADLLKQKESGPAQNTYQNRRQSKNLCCDKYTVKNRRVLFWGVDRSGFWSIKGFVAFVTKQDVTVPSLRKTKIKVFGSFIVNTCMLKNSGIISFIRLVNLSDTDQYRYLWAVLWIRDILVRIPD